MSLPVESHEKQARNRRRARIFKERSRKAKRQRGDLRREKLLSRTYNALAEVLISRRTSCYDLTKTWTGSDQLWEVHRDLGRAYSASG